MNKAMKNNKSTKLFRAVLLLMLIMLVPITASAKKKAYVMFKLATLDYVICNVERQGNSYFIVTSSPNHELIDDHPVLQIRTHRGDVLKLPGQTVAKAAKDNDKGNNIAKFRVTPQQFEKIRSGVERFRISPTANGAVDKEFGRDKIGKELYKLYLKAEDF